jgi:hypothetical protein
MLKLSTHSGFHDLFLKYIHGLESFWIGFMVFNTTFKNISVISWRSVLLVKETWENHRQLSLTTFITYCCIEYTSPCGDCYRYLWLSVLFVLPKDKELGNRKQDKLQRQQIQIPFSTSIHWCHFPNHFDKLGNSSVQNHENEMTSGSETKLCILKNVSDTNLIRWQINIMEPFMTGMTILYFLL